MAQRGEMAEVELLEHDDETLPTVDDVDRARGALRARVRGVLSWARRHRVVTAALAGALVVAIVLPVTVSARDAQERAARFAAQPRVLAPMEQAPQIAWQSSEAARGSGWVQEDRLWVRGDVLVGWEHGTSWVQSLRAVDARTGDPLWTAELGTSPEVTNQEGVSVQDPTWCRAPEAEVVVCMVAEGWTTSEGIATQVDGVDVAPRVDVQPTSLRLRAFDVADGSVVLDRPVAQEASFVTRGADVVLAQTPDPDAGPSTVERLDPATGASRWTASMPRGDGAVGMTYAMVRTLDGTIALSWRGSTQLFTEDGEPSERYGTDQLGEMRGRVWTFGGGIRDAETGRSIGRPESYPAWITTDDGSAPDLLLVQDDTTLRALDVTTGDTAWKVPVPIYASATLLIADGAVAMLVNGALEVRDLRTGTSLWRLSTRDLRGESMVTDGRHLIVLTPGHRRNVTAFGLRDGRLAWNVEPPTSIESLAVVDHRLFGSGGESWVAFEQG